MRGVSCGAPPPHEAAARRRRGSYLHLAGKWCQIAPPLSHGPSVTWRNPACAACPTQGLGTMEGCGTRNNDHHHPQEGSSGVMGGWGKSKCPEGQTGTVAKGEGGGRQERKDSSSLAHQGPSCAAGNHLHHGELWAQSCQLLPFFIRSNLNFQVKLLSF